MPIKDTTTHERKISATFDENEIRDILTKKLSEEFAFDIDPRTTMIEIRFRKEDKDTRGFVNYIDVTMRNDISEGAG